MQVYGRNVKIAEKGTGIKKLSNDFPCFYWTNRGEAVILVQDININEIKEREESDETQ